MQDIHRMRALSTTTQLQSRPRSAAVARQCRGRAPVVRVSQQQQQHGNSTTVTTSRAAQQEEVITEKEEMSRKYNEQMQKQMGWNNPFEV